MTNPSGHRETTVADGHHVLCSRLRPSPSGCDCWQRAYAGLKARNSILTGESDRLRAALDAPLRETILAVLRSMPAEAAPEHLAAQIESQVRAWQELTATRVSVDGGAPE